MADTFIRVETRLPGGREPEEEFLGIEEFLDLVRSCSADVGSFRAALVAGRANVHEMAYAWNPAEVPSGAIEEFVRNLPVDNRLFRPEHCLTITHYPSRDRLVASDTEFGITFRRSDLDQPVATRRQLEKPLWDRLLGYALRFPARHVRFDLASVTDSFGVTLPMVEIVQLLELLRGSNYRSSSELYDVIAVLKPEDLELIYLCGR